MDLADFFRKNVSSKQITKMKINNKTKVCIKNILIATLFSLTVFLLFGNVVASFSGYQIRPVNSKIYNLLIIAFSVAIIIMEIIDEDDDCRSSLNAVIPLLLPMSLFYTSLFDFERVSISAVYYELVKFLCFAYLSIRSGKPGWLRKTSMILSGLLFVPALLMLFVNIGGSHKLVRSYDSPDGRKHADLRVNDQGALGGETSVDVYEYEEKNLLVFSLCKKPVNIYLGRWGEYKDMEIYWKDDTTVVINSKKYHFE